MNRTVWKVILGISIVVLVLSLFLMFWVWAASHVVLGIFVGMTSQESISSQSFVEFYENFPGSPMFCVMLTAGLACIASILMLIFTKRKKVC